jgi:hypothetical protein
MATSLRFNTVNFVEATAAVLKNGTGGGAPALDEVSPFLMTNAMKHARNLLWQNSGGAAMQFDVDLTGAASNKTVRVAGIHGHRPIAGALTGITAYTVKSSTHANGYPPVSANPWTDCPGAVAVATGSGRDKGVVFNSDVTARYFRFDMTIGSTFTLGKFVLGVFDYDLLAIMSAPLERRLVRPNIEDRSIGQDPVRTYVGDPRYLFTIPYRDVVRAHVDKLDAIARLTSSFIFADWTDTFYEAIVQGGETAASLKFVGAVNEIWDDELALETLA